MKEFNDPYNIPSQKIQRGDELRKDLRKEFDNKELMNMIASNIKHQTLPNKIKPTTIHKMNQMLAFKD